MSNNIVNLIKEEARKRYLPVIEKLPWFWDGHILIVVEMTEKLCEFYPSADKEICLLSAYLHDIGRTTYKKGDHSILCLPIIEEILEKYKYPKDKIIKIMNVCRSHRCKDVLPDNLEGKIIASSDAMSHLIGDFYSLLMKYWIKDQDENEVKEKIRKKIDRDFNERIFFPEGKEIVREKYEGWVELLD